MHPRLPTTFRSKLVRHLSLTPTTKHHDVALRVRFEFRVLRCVELPCRKRRRKYQSQLTATQLLQRRRANCQATRCFLILHQPEISRCESGKQVDPNQRRHLLSANYYQSSRDSVTYAARLLDKLEQLETSEETPRIVYMVLLK